MGCGSSAPASGEQPKAPLQTKGGVNLPTAAPMQNDQFQLTAATKVVKASSTDTQSSVPIRAAHSAPSTSGSTTVTNGSNTTSPVNKPAMAPPAIVTGCVTFVEPITPDTKSSDTDDSPSTAAKKIFAVLDRGVLVTCFPNEESEENDYVSDPIQLKDYQVVVDTHRNGEMNAQRNLILVDTEQKETNLCFDSEKEATKWFSAFQAHIAYRSQLVDEKTSAKEFGKNEVKGDSGFADAVAFSYINKRLFLQIIDSQ